MANDPRFDYATFDESCFDRICGLVVPTNSTVGTTELVSSTVSTTEMTSSTVTTSEETTSTVTVDAEG